MNSDTVSVFGGTGYVGSAFCNKFKNIYIQPRSDLVPKTNNILWFISTTDNYNVWGDTKIDVYTNIVLLLDMLKNANRKFGNDFIVNFISSWFVYGKTKLPAKEDVICNPTGFYSITKQTAEKLLISYCQSFKVNYRILRLANVLGVIDKRASPKKNATQFVIGEITQGHPIKIYKEPSWRDFININDCVRAINLIITKGLADEIYNVGNGHAINVKEIFDYVKIKSGNTFVEEIPVPEFHAQVQVKEFWMDISKLLMLGYYPEGTIWETVDEIMNYYENK